MDQRCLVVTEPGDGLSNCRMMTRELPPLAEGGVQVRVAWSALNYKDALCATGHPGVARQLPIVPGIDAVGTVEESRDSSRRVGELVMIAAPAFGTSADGGWADRVQVPADWTWPAPVADLRELAAIGTAGFTAAQCVAALEDAGLNPASGPVVVTGATGGVGTFAVMLLHHLGWQVTAVTGKADRAGWLKELGAAEVADREAMVDRTGRPLLSARWAGGIDTVGGEALGTILRGTRQGGCVAACGLAASNELPVTVYPFILRGIRLQGIDSANVPAAWRKELWGRLTGAWRVAGLERLVQAVRLEEVSGRVRAMLDGQTVGRTLVDPGTERS